MLGWVSWTGVGQLIIKNAAFRLKMVKTQYSTPNVILILKIVKVKGKRAREHQSYIYKKKDKIKTTIKLELQWRCSTKTSDDPLLTTLTAIIVLNDDGWISLKYQLLEHFIFTNSCISVQI